MFLFEIDDLPEEKLHTKLSVAAFLLCALTAMRPADAQVNFDIVIGAPPPPLIVEPAPPSRVGFIWAPGYWFWNGGRHVWRAGHWEVAREGEFYAEPRWMETSGGWGFVPGHWEHGRRHLDRDDFCPPGQAKKGRC